MCACDLVLLLFSWMCVCDLSDLTCRVSLQYNTSATHPLPPGVSTPHLADINITGIEKVIARWERLLGS